MLKEYSGQKTLFQGLRSPVFLFIFQAFLKDRESEQEILDSVLKHHTVLDLTGDKIMTTKQNNSEFSRPWPVVCWFVLHWVHRPLAPGTE